MKPQNKVLVYLVIILGVFLLTTYSCEKNDDPMAIGKTYQGGIIAYRLQIIDPGYDKNVLHGIIVAPNDLDTDSIPWYNGSFTTTGATGMEVGTGNANTNTIVSSQGAGSYAAKLCYDLVLNGYSDWYLPGMEELNRIYSHKKEIGGFSVFYWSSTEFTNYQAWYYDFSTGARLYTFKGIWSFHVRPVRSF